MHYINILTCCLVGISSACQLACVTSVSLKWHSVSSILYGCDSGMFSRSPECVAAVHDVYTSASSSISHQTGLTAPEHQLVFHEGTTQIELTSLSIAY